MQKTMINPPRNIMEVFKMLPEGSLAEIIDNNLFMSPAPSPFHQRLILTLATKLNEHVSSNKLGEVFVSPIDVFFDETSNVVQPDLLLILKNNSVEINSDGIHGVPDFIVDIVSPGNKKHDTTTKKILYEKFGVKEYWIVDPDTKQALGYSLNKEIFEPLPEHNCRIVSSLLNATFEF